MDFYVGGYRYDDPSTSQEAAGSIDATAIEHVVLKAIIAAGPNGANWFELETLTGMERQTISPRFAPLCRKGLIKNSGTRRPGSTHRSQIVWVAA